MIDLWRKIFLSGFIMFIDTQEGSTKILRLVIAATVSTVYLAIIAISRPYKKKNDLHLAFISNLLLTSCFSAGAILRLCDEDSIDESNVCRKFVGKSLNSFRASIIVVASTVSMLIAVAIFLAALAVNSIFAPIVLVLASDSSPNLEMSEGCNFHAFMSHTWSTGQAKTHAITRKLQLHLPKLKIWLDVNDLEDISNFEKYVAEAETFILYYSAGYFRSKNCRREIYTAVRLEKPVLVIYEGDRSVVEELLRECNMHCVDPESPGASSMLQYIFGDGSSSSENFNSPILWLDQNVFSAASLKMIYMRLFSHLPYYQKNPAELSKGLMVPGEIAHMQLKNHVNLLVCENNYGAESLATELKATLPDKESSLISITDADQYLQQQDEDEGDISRASIFSRSSVQFDTKTVLLLYLNRDFFVDSESVLREVVKSSIDDPNIKIVLVHEQDVAKGGCPFNLFFEQVPQVLIDPPYQIFNKETAIPLYSNDEYRTVSLCQILHRFTTVKSMDNKVE